MAAIRVALQIDGLRQPLKKALHTAGRIGFDGVQINAAGELRPRDLTDTASRQLRKLLDDLNLRVGSILLPTRSGIASQHRADQRMAAIMQAMQMASRLQCRLMLTDLGELPRADASGRAMLDDVVRELSSFGQRVGVEIALKAPAGPTEELATFLSGFPDRTVGVDLNPAELMAHGTSPKQFVAGLGRHILHVHAADAVGNLGGSGAQTVELGRGSADFPELLGQLEEYDYRGWVAVVPCGRENIEEASANALAFLRSL